MNLEIIAALGLIGAGFVAVVSLCFWKRARPESEPTQHANTPPPCRITLVAEENPAWKGEKYISKYVEHFRGLGFHPLGAYKIPELGNQRILALLHPTEKFYACVYDSKTLPTFELWAECGSDNSLMGTNSNWVRDVEQRPGSLSIRLANATPQQVLAALRQHEKAADRIAITAEGFVGSFLRAYIRNFNWRLKKGDITRDQLRMDARREGKALTGQELEELYLLKRTAYVAQLEAACRAQYRDQNKVDPDKWRKLQNRLVAIPETFELKEVVNVLSYAVPSTLNERQMQALQGVETSLGDDGIVLIEQIINKNIGELGLRQVGEVTEPVRAWIVLAGGANEPEATAEEAAAPEAPEAVTEEKAAA